MSFRAAGNLRLTWGISIGALLAGTFAQPPARAAVSVNAIGEWGGSVTAIASNGELACLAVERHFLIYDVSESGAPVLVGQSPFLGQGITVVALSGHYALVGEGNGLLRVFDLSDPRHPVEVDTYDTDSDIRDMEMVGDLAYIVGYKTLMILDLTDPLTPSRLALLNIGEDVRGLGVSDGYAYVAFRHGPVGVVDVSDPTQPALVALCDTPGDPYEVVISGDYAFVADGWEGLSILNVSDPQQPALAGTWSNEHIVDVAIAGSHAYLATDYHGLVVLDVSNPAEPNPVASVPGGDAGDAQVILCGTRLHWIDSEGLYLLDVNDPAQPVLLGAAEMLTGSAVAATSHYAYVVARMRRVEIIDFGNPYFPIGLGQLAVTWPIDVALLDGSYLVVLTLHQLQVFDLSDPGRPMPIGTVGLLASGDHVAVKGHRAYVATHAGLEIFDLSDPAYPLPLGTLPLDDILELAAGDSHVYAATRTVGLAIIDALDPLAPTLVSQIPLEGGATGVALDYPFAYVASATGMLVVADVADAAHPAIWATFSNPDVEMVYPSVVLQDGYAMFFDGGKLNIVSVHRPDAPILAVDPHVWAFVGDLAFGDGYLVNAALWDGVVIYDTHLPALGDLNCDGHVNFADINPYVLALRYPLEYQALFPNCSRDNADMNFSGAVTGTDINRFIDLLLDETATP